MNSTKGFFINKLACLFSLMLIAVVPAVCHSAIYTVNNNVDAVAANPNNGICETVAGNGICTLRAAIQVSNGSIGVADTIILPANTYTLSILGTNENLAANGDLDISGPGGALTITGAGAATTTIDGGAIEGVFETIVVGGVGANVFISGVTIRNGNSAIGNGGCIHVGNTAIGTSVTLNNIIVTACTAAGAGAGAGGIDNSGTLNMDTVAVTSNNSPGGAVNNGAAGVLIWTNGEVSSNITGGGIQNNGVINLTNITINGNSPTQGAGIDNDAAATATLLNVTISDNTSNAGVAAIGGIRNANVAIGAVSARNTIISGNTPANCGGTITSQGNNIDSGTTCGFVAGVLGDLPGTAPSLGALALNGAALIQTRALLAGSPAIDKGSATVFPLTDARGITRPMDGNIPPDGVATSDIGAFEFVTPLLTAPLISVTDSIAPPNDNTVPFGGVTAGSSADAVITITNTGTANLVIGTISSVNPIAAPFSLLNDTCSGQTKVPSTSCTLTVRFAPTVNGPASDTFDIPSNVAGTPSLTMTVSGTGGIAPIGTANNTPINPVLVSPTNGQTGLGTTMTFVWNKSTDPDGDAVTYQLIYSTDPNFAVAQTVVDVAAAKSAGLLFAGLGSMGGGIMLFGFVAGNGSRRSRTTTLGIIALILVGALLTACIGEVNDRSRSTTADQQVSKTVTGLAANTTYYWKVVANDSKGGLTTSATFSFKTL
ncbi:MAG: choice-of-anchor D domain-containing protein [Steroidobacteraceae bacterium]|nr:choice-of-anchor D domain-containing protein [Deltaproteobacteria bacterium]